MEPEPICTCGHGRRAHSRNGCTEANPDGSNACRCTVTYMELSPSNPARQIKGSIGGVQAGGKRGVRVWHYLKTWR